MVDNKIIDLYSIIRLTKYAVNTIKNHRLMFVTEINTVDVVKGLSKIGEPSNIDNPNANNSSSTSVPVPSTINTNTSNSNNSNNSTPASNYNSNATNSSNSGFKASSLSTSASSTSNSFNLNGSQPISSLSPYKDRNVINARVTSKTEVKKWTNERGEGRLFSVSLLDSSGEIRLTCFNDAVDQYFDLLQIGKIYEFSNFQVKIAKRQYGSIQNDYEIAVDSNTTIKAVLDEVSEIPKILYSFIPISKIAENKKDE